MNASTQRSARRSSEAMRPAIPSTWAVPVCRSYQAPSTNEYARESHDAWMLTYPPTSLAVTTGAQKAGSIHCCHGPLCFRRHAAPCGDPPRGHNRRSDVNRHVTDRSVDGDRASVGYPMRSSGRDVCALCPGANPPSIPTRWQLAPQEPWCDHGDRFGLEHLRPDARLVGVHRTVVRNLEDLRSANGSRRRV